MRYVVQNKRLMYFVLSILVISIMTMTIVYAALNTILRINGNAEVIESSWDIYLDNVDLHSGSVTQTKPTIIDKTTASFTTILTKPGDYYMFTVDVVNRGSIDAMIDGIVKTPTLSESQAKYLNYIVEYENGNQISTKQLVKANSSVRLKVKLEYRTDLVASDLPTTTETLNLLFKLNYVQADKAGTSNVQNNGKLVKVVSGDYDTVGSEVCIDTECFYVISSTENDVTMLAKYNLYVGNIANNDWTVNPIDNPTGIQDSTAKAYVSGTEYYIGTIGFSNTDQKGINYSDYKGSIVEGYVSDYGDYLFKLGLGSVNARLITIDELVNLGCDTSNANCSLALEWVYSTSYWTGSAFDDSYIWVVFTDKSLSKYRYLPTNTFGVRPVITISKSEF